MGGPATKLWLRQQTWQHAGRYIKHMAVAARCIQTHTGSCQPQARSTIATAAHISPAAVQCWPKLQVGVPCASGCPAAKDGLGGVVLNGPQSDTCQGNAEPDSQSADKITPPARPDSAAQKIHCSASNKWQCCCGVPCMLSPICVLVLHAYMLLSSRGTGISLTIKELPVVVSSTWWCDASCCKFNMPQYVSDAGAHDHVLLSCGMDGSQPRQQH